MTVRGCEVAAATEVGVGSRKGSTHQQGGLVDVDHEPAKGRHFSRVGLLDPGRSFRPDTRFMTASVVGVPSTSRHQPHVLSRQPRSARVFGSNLNCAD